MNDQRATREILAGLRRQVASLEWQTARLRQQNARLRASIDEVKARQRLLEQQAGWDADALEFPR